MEKIVDVRVEIDYEEFDLHFDSVNAFNEWLIDTDYVAYSIWISGLTLVIQLEERRN